MEIQPDALRRDIVAQIREIEAQIAEIEKFAKERGITPYSVTDQNGAWVMPQMLLAKVTAYNSLVVLQMPKPPRSGPGQRR